MKSDNSQSLKDSLPIGAKSPENKDQNTINDSQKNKSSTSGLFFPQYNINISIPQNIPLSQTTNFPSCPVPTQSQLSNQIFPQYNVNIILPQIIAQTLAPTVSVPSSPQTIQNQFPYQFNVNIVLPQNITSSPACNIPSFTQTSQNQSTDQITPQYNINVAFSQNNTSENANKNDKKEEKEKQETKQKDTNTKPPTQTSILSESDYGEYEQDTLSDKEEQNEINKEKVDEKTSKIEKVIKTRNAFGGFSLGKGDPREISNPSNPMQLDNTGRKYSQSKVPQINFMSLSKSESSLFKLNAALNRRAWIGQKSMQDSPPFGSSWKTQAFPPEPIDLWKTQNGTGVFRSSSAANLASICAANLVSDSAPNIESVSTENLVSSSVTNSVSKPAAKMESNSAENTESCSTANLVSNSKTNKLCLNTATNDSDQPRDPTTNSFKNEENYSQHVSKSFYSYNSVSYSSNSPKKGGSKPDNDC